MPEVQMQRPGRCRKDETERQAQPDLCEFPPDASSSGRNANQKKASPLRDNRDSHWLEEEELRRS
jgi:hypothetical protein